MSASASSHGVVAGVVLAAGRSARMGVPKPLLEREGETFLARAVRVLREGGCAPVFVVVAAGDAPVRAAAEATGARVLPNRMPAAEQVDSVRLALRSVRDADGAMVLPVDLPYVSPGTVSALVRAWRASRSPVVVPEHGGVAGHPILLDRALHPIILETELPDGLRSLLLANASGVEAVAVEDAGILVDLDTPADLHRHGLGA